MTVYSEYIKEYAKRRDITFKQGARYIKRSVTSWNQSLREQRKRETFKPQSGEQFYYKPNKRGFTGKTRFTWRDMQQRESVNKEARSEMIIKIDYPTVKARIAQDKKHKNQMKLYA